MNFELVCVQSYPELIDECIELLNSQWPRSKTARLVSIQQGSADGFPTALVLVNKGPSSASPGKVIAHSKVTLVSAQQPNACFIESVVVDKNLRGKGIGRTIMEMTEDYVKKKGITTAYLTTHDQQGFYEKLGYFICPPIVIFGGKCQPFPSVKETEGELVDNLNKLTITPHEAEIIASSKLGITKVPPSISAKNTPPPPPVAPPPPPMPIGKIRKDDIKIIRNNNEIKVTMKKIL